MWRSGLPVQVSRANSGRSRKLRDRDVVRVPISSIRAECDDGVGPNAPDMSGDCANSNSGLNLVHGAVRVTQDRDFADTQHLGGRLQLRFPSATCFGRIGAISVSAE